MFSWNVPDEWLCITLSDCTKTHNNNKNQQINCKSVAYSVLEFTPSSAFFPCEILEENIT